MGHSEMWTGMSSEVDENIRNGNSVFSLNLYLSVSPGYVSERMIVSLGKLTLSVHSPAAE